MSIEEKMLALAGALDAGEDYGPAAVIRDGIKIIDKPEAKAAIEEIMKDELTGKELVTIIMASVLGLA